MMHVKGFAEPVASLSMRVCDASLTSQKPPGWLCVRVKKRVYKLQKIYFYHNSGDLLPRIGVIYSIAS